jgi:hypothetical protein
MIELLPLFFAGYALVALGIGAGAGSLIKICVLGFFFGSNPPIGKRAVVATVFAEVIILAVSFLICLNSIMSQAPGYHGDTAKLWITLLCCSAVLYCVMALLPNLILLSKMQNQSNQPLSRNLARADFALLLSAPTFLSVVAGAAVVHLALFRSFR